MRFLKNNKALLAVAAFLPFSVLYLDVPITSAAHQFRGQAPAYIRLLEKVINCTSHGSTLVIGSVVILLLGRYLKRRGLFGAGRALLIAYAASGIAVQVLKHLIGRARPRITETVLFIGPTLRGGYDSFPSGHTAVAFCFAYTLSRLSPRLGGLFYVLAAIAGLGRIGAAAHFFSDVVAGAAVGILTGKLLFAYVLPRFTPSPIPLPPEGEVKGGGA